MSSSSNREPVFEQRKSEFLTVNLADQKPGDALTLGIVVSFDPAGHPVIRFLDYVLDFTNWLYRFTSRR